MISACMIVKNEEKHLKECLESLRFIEEVILVDTGSTDKTLTIAREFPNVKIFKKKLNIYYFKKWKLKKLFNYSAARNYSLSKATGDWILIIDADERVENPEEIKKLVNDYPEVMAWRLDQVSIRYQNGKKVEVPCSSTRLWRNGLGICYRKIVHETVDEYLDENNLRVEKCDSRLNHVGFIDTGTDRMKAMRVIEAIEYEDQPYKWYYLGVAYSQIKDIDSATDCFIKAVQSPMSDNIKAHAFAILADIYRQSSGFYKDLAIEMIGHSIKLAPKQNLSYLIKAEILKETGNRNKASKIYKELRVKGGMKTDMHSDILLSEGDINSMIHDNYV